MFSQSAKTQRRVKTQDPVLLNSDSVFLCGLGGLGVTLKRRTAMVSPEVWANSKRVFSQSPPRPQRKVKTQNPLLLNSDSVFLCGLGELGVTLKRCTAMV